MSNKKAQRRSQSQSRPTQAVPVFRLSSYDPVEVVLPEMHISEAQVDDQIKRIAEQYTALEATGHSTVRPGDHVRIQIESTRNGEPYRNLTGIRILEPGEGFMPKEFEDEVAAMHVGETKTVSFEAPTDEEPGSAAATCAITATVTLLEILAQNTPEITDEWVSRFIPGAATVAEFRDVVKKQMREEAAQRLEQEKQFKAASVLARRLEGHIPDEMIEEALRESQKNFETALRQKGMNRDEYLVREGISEQILNMQMLVQTREMLAQALALDAMAEHLSLKVTDADLDAALGAKTPEQAAQARKAAEEAGRLAEVRKIARRNKAVKWVADHAQVTYLT